MTGSGTRLAPTDCAWEVVHGSGMVVVVCLVEGGAAADRDVEWLRVSRRGGICLPIQLIWLRAGGS